MFNISIIIKDNRIVKEVNYKQMHRIGKKKYKWEGVMYIQLCFFNLWFCMKCEKLYFTLEKEPMIFDCGFGLCYNCDPDYQNRKITEFL